MSSRVIPRVGTAVSGDDGVLHLVDMEDRRTTLPSLEDITDALYSWWTIDELYDASRNGEVLEIVFCTLGTKVKSKASRTMRSLAKKSIMPFAFVWIGEHEFALSWLLLEWWDRGSHGFYRYRIAIGRRD